jgi:GT2 family glycosyltransferase
MDDDAIADKDFIENILRFFETHPDADGLGGRIIPKYIPEEPKWMSYYVSSLVGNFDYSDKVEEFKQGKYPLESNMIVKKKDFLEVGGFNTNLPVLLENFESVAKEKNFFTSCRIEGKKYIMILQFRYSM